MLRIESRGLSKTSLTLLNAPKGVNLCFNKEIITQILNKNQETFKERIKNESLVFIRAERDF